MHVIAGKAVCLGEALKPEFKEYGKKVVENAQALANGLTKRGVKLVSGGTDNHLMLIDLSGTELTGKELAVWMKYISPQIKTQYQMSKEVRL